MTVDKAASLRKDANGPVEGFDAFFYPPVAIIRGSSTMGIPSRYGKRHVNVRVDVNGTTTVITTDDGFIGILLLEEEKAFEVLNTLFATMSLTWGIPGFVLTKDDLSSFTYSPEEWSLDIHLVKPQAERNMFSFMRDNEATYHIWRFIPRRTAITSDQFTESYNYDLWGSMKRYKTTQSSEYSTTESISGDIDREQAAINFSLVRTSLVSYGYSPSS
jgi:hypothetical protein